MNTLPYGVLRFSQKLYNSQVPLFRAAIIEEVGRENELFHNHTKEQNIQYPYIQYKVIHKCASIVGIGPGCMYLHKTAKPEMALRIGKEYKKFNIESFEFAHETMGVNGNVFNYSLRTWMPLNQDNFQEYTKLKNELAKLKMLEDLLKKQVVGFYYAVGIPPGDEVLVKIDRIKSEKVLRFKGVLMHTFNINFQSNMYIPDFLGLGKGSAFGYGSVMKFSKNN